MASKSLVIWKLKIALYRLYQTLGSKNLQRLASQGLDQPAFSVALPPTTINGQQIRFEPIRTEDFASLSNFLLHYYIPDQPFYRVLGSGDRLRRALATPESQESAAFMRETQDYLRRGLPLFGPAIKSVPNVSFKAICETNGELIGVSLANVMNMKTGEGIEIEYVFNFWRGYSQMLFYTRLHRCQSIIVKIHLRSDLSDLPFYSRRNRLAADIFASVFAHQNQICPPGRGNPTTIAMTGAMVITNGAHPVWHE